MNRTCGQCREIDAGLGRKEEAIREARRAVDLMPIAKDSLNGPSYVANLALVYAWTGERDRALEQLEIVATIPGLARHTAISSSIRAGMICAVISASTKSLPQPKLPADSSSPRKGDRSAVAAAMTVALKPLLPIRQPNAPKQFSQLHVRRFAQDQMPSKITKETCRCPAEFS